MPDDGHPIEDGVEALRGNLGVHGDGEDRRADSVIQVHGHRDRDAARLAQGGDEDLDDPEEEGDLGDFV